MTKMFSKITRNCIIETFCTLGIIQIVLGENVCLNVTVLTDTSKRGTGCLGTALSEMVCDRQLTEGWYIAQHGGEILQMPTSCPSILACGTSGGIWLNGDHPTDVNTTVTVNACRRGFSSDDNECCAEMFPIQVKNCGNFYAYYLKYTTACSQAYCFGSHVCPVTTAATTTISSTTIPNVFTVPDNKTTLLSTVATSHGHNIGYTVCLNVTALDDMSKRGTSCLGTEVSSMVCDRQLAEGWYVARHDGKFLEMPTTCPSMLSCGTSGGIWLNGNHPKEVNTTVTVDACRRGFPTDIDECCAERMPIQVRNCGSFYAYYLKYTTSCHQGYCFGSHSCPAQTTQKEAANTTPLRMNPSTVSDHGHQRNEKTDETGVWQSIFICMVISGVLILIVAVFLYLRFRKGSPTQKKQHVIFPNNYYKEKQLVPEQQLKMSKEPPPYSLFVSPF